MKSRAGNLPMVKMRSTICASLAKTARVNVDFVYNFSMSRS